MNMAEKMIKLEEISESNRDYYRAFEEAYQSDLSRYQSRIYPNAGSQLLKWCYIKYADEYIGSIWLEKEEKTSRPVLGVFIANEANRNKGFGKQAIGAILGEVDKMGIDEIYLRVREQNVRALSCYRSMGFREIRRFKKSDFYVVEMVFRTIYLYSPGHKMLY